MTRLAEPCRALGMQDKSQQCVSLRTFTMHGPRHTYILANHVVRRKPRCVHLRLDDRAIPEAVNWGCESGERLDCGIHLLVRCFCDSASTSGP
jgi:hypothetical protein